MLGMQMALDIDIGRAKEHTRTAAGIGHRNAPLLCGPGAITTVLLLSEQNGMLITAVAIALTLIATFAVLRFSFRSRNCWESASQRSWRKILGMLVAAIAVSIKPRV